MLLLPWQARLFRVLMALFGVLLVNSAVLWSYTSTPNPPLFYYAMLLSHFALGLLVVIPFAIYAVSHQRRARSLSHNRAAITFGLGTAVVVTLCLGSGLYLFGVAAFGGAVTRNREWLLVLHRLVAWAIPFAYLLHMRARGVNRRRVAVAVASLLVVVLVGEGRASNLLSVDPYVNQASPFFPSESTSSTGQVLPVNLLLSSQQCANCHGDIYRQWNDSAHHFSSFNNPWYKASVDYMRDIDGPTATQWCGGCHDAAMLLPGLMKMKEKSALPESHAGVACLVCHGIVAVKNTTGNGSYVLAPPPEYPWEGDGNPLMAGLSRFLIRVKPAPHRAAMLKPMHIESQFCSACHKVSLSEPVDNYRWFRGFNTWDEFQDSGVSGFSARSFYQPPHPMTCASCHMPLVPSQDFGNVHGQVHSHRFPGANTALPLVNGCPEQMQSTLHLLQDGAVTLDMFAAGAPAEALSVTPGQSLRADLVVRTRKVGHAFPTGTADAFEVWTELKATDAQGKVVFWSGFVRDDGTIDPTAHFFRTVLVDGHSNRINKRNAWMRRSTVYNEVIPPGAAKVVRYRMDVPADAALPLTLEARLHYRKFDDAFNRFSFGGHAGAGSVDKSFDDRAWDLSSSHHPDLPVIDIASAHLQLGPGSHNDSVPWPLWERYNDYGIGLLLATDYTHARTAFETVTRVNPQYPDGYVNVGRVLLAEGSDALAETWLRQALAIDANNAKAHYFLGVSDKNQGHVEQAITDLLQVEPRFPDDRVMQNQLGRLYLLSGNVPEAVRRYQHTLDIDPEDANAHQGLMLCYQSQGNEALAHEHELRFLRYRPREVETKLNGPFLRADPNMNREAQPIHEHPNGLVN